MTLHDEYGSKVDVALPKGDVHRQMEVFYNPLMKSNRSISILLLNSIPHEKMRIADTMAGSGIRSIRFLRELREGKIETLFVNDYKESFPKKFEGLLQLNSLEEKKGLVEVSSLEATQFLLSEGGFDYIEVDPFGTPNPFLAAAVARISREGILAVTATDTAALSGTYPKVTQRKYWAKPLKNYMMHETGLRILIRKVQLQGIQFEKAFVPILAYHKDHYFRIYFRCEKGKEKCDAIVRELAYLLWCRKCLNHKTSNCNNELCCEKTMEYAGPLWTGALGDEKLADEMIKNNLYPEEQKFLELLRDELKVKSVGFYDVHELARIMRIDPPKLERVLTAVQGVRSHLCPTGVKTVLGLDEMKDAMRKSLQ